MGPELDKVSELETTRLSDRTSEGLSHTGAAVTYRPVPHSHVAGDPRSRSVWRVCFELVTIPSVRFGLDINGAVVFGRGKEGSHFVDLSPYGADDMGVSRHHMLLRPTAANLVITDLGSTNGTWLNGCRVGMNMPYNLKNGDLVALGRLEFVVRVIRRPTGHTVALRDRADLGEALIQIAQAISSQLELDGVLDRALEMAMALTAAGETAVWLVDEQTGELFLEAERGIGDERIRHVRLPVTDTLVGKVIRTGKPLRASRETEGERVKIKTGYLVEAVIYAPLALGGVPFGVLMAAHRDAGKSFDARDEKLLMAIADLAAIAVQNSRLFGALERSLSELRVAQGQLVQSARLAALGELTAIVAHQINNPLTTILADAEVLMQDLPPEHTSHKSASAIFRAGKRVRSTVRRLLNVGRPSDDMQPIDVNDTIRAALDLVSGQLQARGNRLMVDLAPNMPKINALPGHLEDVWLNLLINARDALHGKESATIGIRSALVDAGEVIEVTVFDSGEGISPEHTGRIFDPFFTTKPRNAGTGLGLYICKQVVSQHDGQISVHSELGKGTRVSVRLPVSGIRVRSRKRQNRRRPATPVFQDYTAYDAVRGRLGVGEKTPTRPGTALERRPNSKRVEKVGEELAPRPG